MQPLLKCAKSWYSKTHYIVEHFSPIFFCLRSASIVLVVLMIILSSCSEKSPECGDPTATVCRLILVDSNNNQLIGTTYDEDSIQLTASGQVVPLTFDNAALLFNFGSWNITGKKVLLVKLNGQVTDTLNMYIRVYTNECWSSSILDSLQYNGKLIPPSTANTFEIIKDN